MGEKRGRKERRREAPKPSEKLPPLSTPSDKPVAAKQVAFCKSVVEDILQDETSLSFSKPVGELWDMSQLTDYFEKIKNPMDLGTVNKKLSSGAYNESSNGLFSPNDFRHDLRLVFLNAIEYNAKGTDLFRLSCKFLQYIDSRMVDLPGQSEPVAGIDFSEREDATDKSRKLAGVSGKSELLLKDGSEIRKNGSDEEGIRAGGDEGPDDDVHVDDDLVKNEARTSTEDEEERLVNVITTCSKNRARAEAALAELELMRNVPLSHEENAKLRDDVEALPWETAKKVVKILRKYVDEALAESTEEDPEFVTLEFSTIEPRLLRDIESLVRPDPRVERERTTIASLTAEIKEAERKLGSLPSREHGQRKKPRRRR